MGQTLRQKQNARREAFRKSSGASSSSGRIIGRLVPENTKKWKLTVRRYTPPPRAYILVYTSPHVFCPRCGQYNYLAANKTQFLNCDGCHKHFEAAKS